ncbi:hypothetical protein HJC23_008186 [Cyclotella cryptica]|uniref:Membrane-associated protein n=1 Tax=Cyclotella cryptica TaxID=29204 RepID=A0ABD3PEQ8_9STRA
MRPLYHKLTSNRVNYIWTAVLVLGINSLWMSFRHMTSTIPQPQISQAQGTFVPIDTRNVVPENEDRLPNCDELMQRPSTPFADGAFLTRKSTLVVWKMRHDGSQELTLPTTCQLKRYTAHEAGMCLKGKSLLFIGDSLTRYQFLSFAYFLEHKKWPMRFHSAFQPCHQIDVHGNEMCSKRDEPNVCSEGDWIALGGWPKFMQSIGGGTDGSIFRGRMEAQSVRAVDSIEGYQYISSKEDGGTKLTLVSEYGWSGNEVFRGWNFSGCALNATCRYTPQQYQRNIERNDRSDFDWDYTDIVTAFGPKGSAFRAQHDDTNYIFYNRGLWGALQENKATLMMEAISNMTRRKSELLNRCFFRSTTGAERARSNNLDSVEHELVRKAAYYAGCEYFDVAHVTEEFSLLLFKHPTPPGANEYKYVFWDSLHYGEFVSYADAL